MAVEAFAIMSNGKMKSAYTHYMKSQTAMSMK